MFALAMRVFVISHLYAGLNICEIFALSILTKNIGPAQMDINVIDNSIAGKQINFLTKFIMPPPGEIRRVFHPTLASLSRLPNGRNDFRGIFLL